MKQLQGMYCKDCKIFTDNIKNEAVALIQSMLNQCPFKGAHVCIMPDAHMGMLKSLDYEFTNYKSRSLVVRQGESGHKTLGQGRHP